MLTCKICNVIISASILIGFIAGPRLVRAQTPTSIRPAVSKFSKRPANTSAETLLGERLFLETRFAQFFAEHSNGDMNRPLVQGDPVVAKVWNPRAGVTYPSPFAGKSINCRSCHLVDEFTTLIGGMNRTYADYRQRSPIPYRSQDTRTVTVRNTRSMVDDFTPRHPEVLLHGDGEFASVESITKSVMTGRTFGWLSNEHDEAIHHIAKVIREDDGRDELGQQYGGSYAKLLLGSVDVTDQFRISKDFRMDVKAAGDQQVVDEVARLIGVFLKSLQFEHTPQGVHSGSAYDMFLAKNNLPVLPDRGETDVEYSQRLLQMLENLQNPRFILPYERWLRFHPHVLEFGEPELAGLKLFLRQGAAPEESLTKGIPAASHSVSHAGNCFACHPAPDFTDVSFHNTGAAQEEFDALHGPGSFAKIAVPSYEERKSHPDMYLPATPSHPHAAGLFRSLPAMSNASATDLGMWNVFANSDFPDVQSQMRSLLCGTEPCDPQVELPLTIARVRTPTLRDTGHSWPYLHTGRMPTVEDVLHYYLRMSGMAREGKLRNGDPELTRISLSEEDIVALAAFLRSLDEDYDN